jgi:hypothetical protein
LNLILNYEKGIKNGKIDNSSFILKQKPIKKRPEKEKENLYSEKISKRKTSANKYKIIKTIKKENEESSDSDSNIISDSYSENNKDNINTNNNNNYCELSKESYNDLKNPDVNSVKLKKNKRQEKKLKIKNGIFIKILLKFLILRK